MQPKEVADNSVLMGHKVSFEELPVHIDDGDNVNPCELGGGALDQDRILHGQADAFCEREYEWGFLTDP